MNKTVLAAMLLAFAASPALALDAASPAQASPVVVTKGKMLLSADGARLAPVYRVADASAKIIIDGRMVSVPVSTISLVGGKLTTSLTKSDVIALP